MFLGNPSPCSREGQGEHAAAGQLLIRQQLVHQPQRQRCICLRWRFRFQLRVRARGTAHQEEAARGAQLDASILPVRLSPPPSPLSVSPSHNLFLPVFSPVCSETWGVSWERPESFGLSSLNTDATLCVDQAKLHSPPRAWQLGSFKTAIFFSLFK